MTQPKLLTTAWGENGLRNAIPHTRTDDMAQENATYADGFPSVTMTPISLGGKPPSGKDMNGVLHEITAHLVYQSKGQRYRFDATHCQAIGGYPKGAVLMNDRADTEYISLVDKNTANFNVATVNIAGKWAVLSSAIQLANKADKSTQISAGNGLTGGGALSENRTFALGTPSSITATSANSVSASSHSHAIDKASTSVAGIVKLNNSLTSTATNEALTALQGKNLAEQIASAVSGSLNLKGSLAAAQNLNDLLSEANYGVWQNSSNGNATTEKNYPTNKAGTLLVLPSAYKGQQVYFPYDDKGIYIRDTRSNAATPTWGDWYKLAAPENTLNSTSTIAPLSAAMGKKLNDEKLGNSGTQTLNGNLHIIRNAWEKLRFVHNNGSYWRFETHPDGGDSNSSMRFNYVFMGADNTEKSRIAFPESVGTSTVAYQGWVAEQLSAAKPNNFSGIDLDSATAPQFFINAKTGYVAAAGGEHAGLILGYQNDCSQIIAAGGNLWVRGSDHNPISDPSHWSAWKRILDENNGVMLSGDQTISGVKTFANHIHTRAEIHAGGVITNSYRNDWVGYQAKQPTEGKNGFFDVLVNNVARGGMQVTAEGGGKYATKLLVTPSGATNTDRRVVGMAVMDTAIHTQAYGLLHEYFATKAEMNTKSTVAVLTGKIAHGGTIPLPAGFSQAQCKWMVSMHNDNPTSQTWDIQESGAYNHYNATVWTDANRVVHCRVYKHGHSVSASGWQNAEANYMIIGVK